MNWVLSDLMKKDMAEEDYVPFASLVFPLATKLMCPVVAIAAADSVTDIRTSVPGFC